MAATAAISTSSQAGTPKTLSWQEFKNRYLSREDQYKYEWVNGTVEKTLRSMDKTQIYLLANLTRFLYTLIAVNPHIDGDLIAEGDTFFAGNHRRPDISYYTKAQLRAARLNEDVHPDFVIEVISHNDQIMKLLKKMVDYRNAGVQVIWHIFPQQQEVHVYHGKQMVVCTGDDICSAEAVIKGFSLSVKDIFK